MPDKHVGDVRENYQWKVRQNWKLSLHELFMIIYSNSQGICDESGLLCTLNCVMIFIMSSPDFYVH